MTPRQAMGLWKAHPFAGLRPFGIADKDFFFGRLDQIAALYRLLDRNRFIAVIGSSGSGKSSLTRAGLLPILEEENDEGHGSKWQWCTMRPGDAPVKALARALVKLSNVEDDAGDANLARIQSQLNASTFSLAEAISQAGVAPEAKFVLVVDQFEELFRYSDQRRGPDQIRNERAIDQADHFVALLLDGARSTLRDIRILITMRSDFIGECANFYGLAEAVSATQFLVPGLTRDQLKDVICLPVQKPNTIDPLLVQQLLNDAERQLDELPVLQHCLLQLWEKAGEPLSADADREPPNPDYANADTPRHITTDHYASVGKVSGALSLHADKILLGLPEKSVAKVFRALSELKDGRIIRRARAYGDLRGETGLPDGELRTIVNRFRADDCSFLVTFPPDIGDVTDDTRIDVSHEALLRHWEKCSGTHQVTSDAQGDPALGWLEDERRDGQIYQFLQSLADARRRSDKVENIESHWDWWTTRKPTESWTNRYGGKRAKVDGMLRAGWNYRNKYRGLVFGVGVLVMAAIASLATYVFKQQQDIAVQDKIAVENLAVAVGFANTFLNQVLGALNRGQIQVSAALAMEKSLREEVERKLQPQKGRTVVQSPATVALESHLNFTAADIFFDAGQAQDATEQAQKAKDLAETLVEKDATNAQWRDLLMESTQRLGDALELARDYEGALAQFRTLQGMVKDRATMMPSNSYLESNSAYYDSRAGDLLLKRGKPKDALVEFQRALDSARTHAGKSEPEIYDWQSAVPRYLAKVAAAEGVLGDFAGSKRDYDEAIGIQEILAKKPGANAALLSNLAISYEIKADVLAKQERWDAAAAAYTKAIGIHKALVAKDEKNATWLSYLASEKRGLAMALDRSVRLKEAAAALDDEIVNRNQLIEIDTKSRNFQADLDDAQKRLDTVKSSLETRN